MGGDRRRRLGPRHRVGRSPESIRFEVVSREEGLSSDTIYGVLSDSKGSLWLSGNAGLMRFDPQTHAVKTYHREHGLQGEEFDFERGLSVARRPPVLRRAGRIQHFRSVAPDGQCSCAARDADGS